MILFYL